MYKNIHTEIKDNILYVTINREAKLNALNVETLTELNKCFLVAKANVDVRVVIITGAGEKSFVAGADISEFVGLNDVTAADFARQNQQTVFDVIENLGKPVIAAINGFALGGGLELAMACHIRVASTNAKMGQPEVTLGLIPGYGGTQRLTQLVGRGKAIEIITTADMIGSEEALRIGLVNHVVAQEDLMKKCIEIAQKIVSKAPIAIAQSLVAILAQGKSNNDFEAEINAFGKCFATQDLKEGVAAFLEKRKPNFQGR